MSTLCNSKSTGAIVITDCFYDNERESFKAKPEELQIDMTNDSGNESNDSKRSYQSNSEDSDDESKKIARDKKCRVSYEADIKAKVNNVVNDECNNSSHDDRNHSSKKINSLNFSTKDEK